MQFLIIMAFFSLFTSEINKDHPDEIAGKIIDKTAKYAHKKYPLKACGVGMAAPGKVVRKITICFCTKYTLSKEQLRFILVDLGREQIYQINSNQNIQQFLFKKPFTIKEANIIIYNHDKNGEESLYPLISTSQIGQGIVNFRSYDPLNPCKVRQELDETYEESLEIIQNQK